MRSIFLIVTILTATALTQDPDECKFSEAAQHCYGAMGKPLIFHVPNTTINVRLKKDEGYLILVLKKNKIKNAHEELASHAELLPNGRFSLGNATKKHSGDYMLEVFTADGRSKGILNVHLEILAPVSKPAVSQECLSTEKKTVSCSSEGDGLEFNLTLNGHSLMQTKDYSKFLNSREQNMSSPAGIEAQNNPNSTTVSISLYGQLTGDLMCNVRNKVSSEEALIHLDRCKDPDECKFSEAAQHCYSAEGHPLIFHVPNTAINFRLMKDEGSLILDLYQNKITNAHEEFASHAELLAPGRFSLGNSTKKHSGDYMLEVFTADGRSKGTLHVHLEIQAPVSKPAVSQKCLSTEKKTVSCSSEGDGLEFNLTLNGHSLMQTKDNSKFLYSREQNMSSPAGIKARNNPRGSAVSISLYGQLTGDLMCDVGNKVSRERTVFQLQSCKVGPSSSSSFIVAAVRAAVLAVLILIAPIWALINLCDKYRTPVAVNEDVTKNPEEETTC